MFRATRLRRPLAVLAFLSLSTSGLLAVGCAGGGDILQFIGTPYPLRAEGATISGPSTSGTVSGGTLGGGGRTDTDPCSETQTRKFVRISMRNESVDYIHYFFVMVAYVRSTTHTDGAVCPDDIETYVRNGYSIVVDEGESQAFGNVCIDGPALIRFHEGGRFQGAGTTGLASAIAPAEGDTPTYDSFFGASGRQLPVPNLIWFHNPGTGEGAALHQAATASAPCDIGTLEVVDTNCAQDSFYYVDEFDNRVGSVAGSTNPYVRFPSEIQGTGCRCFGTDEAWAELAPSGATAATVRCNEFLRGGSIEFVFLNDTTEPPPPQLVWRVKDASGAVAHDFDDRANIN